MTIALAVTVTVVVAMAMAAVVTETTVVETVSGCTHKGLMDSYLDAATHPGRKPGKSQAGRALQSHSGLQRHRPQSAMASRDAEEKRRRSPVI